MSPHPGPLPKGERVFEFPLPFGERVRVRGLRDLAQQQRIHALDELVRIFQRAALGQ